MSSTKIRAGITKPAKDRHRAGSTLEASRFTLVLCFDLFANFLDEFRRNPASRRLTLGHFFRRLETEDIDIAEDRLLNAAIGQVAAQFAKLPYIKAELRDGVVGTGGKFLFEFEVLIRTVRFRVFERRHCNSNPQRQAALPELIHQRNKLHGVQVEDGILTFWIIAGQRENVFQIHAGDGFQELPELLPVPADAGDVNVRRKAACARGRSDAERILTGGASRITRNTSRHNARSDRQLGSNFEKPGFAGYAARHNLDHVTEPARLQRFL